MALVLKDRVRQTTTSTGASTITLSGSVAGYQSFSVIGTGNTTYYTIAGTSDWEVGIGTWTSPNQLSRDTILASTNGGAAVNFGAGTKDVFVTYPAEKSVNINANDGDAIINGMTVGLGGGQDTSNVAIGVAALSNNSTGQYNVGIGSYALGSNDTGSNNMAIGDSSLNNNLTGDNNTAIGTNTLGTYSGSWNTAIGTYALNYLGSSNDGSNNLAIGGNALNQLGLIDGGNNNTAIGVNALGLLDNTIGGGNNNVAIGYSSGSAIDGASNNVIIGSYTGSAAPISVSGNNYVVLSDGAGNVRQTINGSGALSFNAGTSYGTAGQLLQSNGSGAAPSWGRTITSGTAAPSGGSDGDIYLQYV